MKGLSDAALNPIILDAERKKEKNLLRNIMVKSLRPCEFPNNY